jgi:CheY-like chemotaxis protein
MGAKRALIVDDSKSARLFLARVLEKYDIDVDSAESAEAAIEYLSGNRPDVIFMDHLMTGMDGLQAVRAIKNDPRTATIPIMMYTSQEGEVYLGQARALGAVGVLPKQIKPADVSKVLYQLHLVPDRRISEQSSFTAVTPRAEGTRAEPGAPSARVLTESTLREHFAELRRALVAGVDTQTDRITAEVRALLLEALPPPPLSPADPTPHRAATAWPWIVASVALAVALSCSALWWRSVQLLRRLEVAVTQLRAQQTAPAFAAPVSPQAGAAGAFEAGTHEIKPIVLPVPFGAEPLGGARMDIIRLQLYRLARQKVTGVADIETFAGRFCLLGNAREGYSPRPRRPWSHVATCSAILPRTPLPPRVHRWRSPTSSARSAALPAARSRCRCWRVIRQTCSRLTRRRVHISTLANGTAPPLRTTGSRFACIETDGSPRADR